MTRLRAGLFFIPVVLGLCTVQTSTAQAPAEPVRRVILVLLPGARFEDLMSVPDLRAMAGPAAQGNGGVGLMTTGSRPEPDHGAELAPSPFGGQGGLLIPILGGAGVGVCQIPGSGDWSLAAMALGPQFIEAGPCDEGSAGRVLAVAVAADAPEAPDQVAGGAGAGPSLVVVASPFLSDAMRRAGDETPGLIVARWTGGGWFQGSRRGPVALTSDTTRRDGLVADVDLVPTVLQSFGLAVPDHITGSAIRVTGGPAPFGLHRLHLQHRRIRVPLQAGELAFVVGLFVVGAPALMALGRGRRVPPGVLAALRILALSGAAMMIPLGLGGLLPRLSYLVVVPFVIGSTVALVLLARAAPWPGPVAPFTFLGAVGLVVLVVDLVFLGGRGLSMPLGGGTMFDGVRFYGLPNLFIPLLLASAIFVATALSPVQGTVLLAAIGLFAGLPELGANVGACAALFAATGVWWVLRTRGRVDIRGLAFIAGTMILGLAAVLLWNRYLTAVPAHPGRFLEATDGGLVSGLERAWDRMAVGLGMANRVPAAYLPLIGLPILLWMSLAEIRPFGPAFGRVGRIWRDAMITLTSAGIVAFFANDTGVAAAGPVFLFAMVGMAYPAFIDGNRPDGSQLESLRVPRTVEP